MLSIFDRAERRKNQVCSTYEYRKVFERIGHLPPQVQHLVVQLGQLDYEFDLRAYQCLHRLGIPIAYPRMTFIETVLESKLNPLVAMGKRGSSKASGFVNKFNADAELLDDLVSSFNIDFVSQAHQRQLDHWTAKYHKVVFHISNLFNTIDIRIRQREMISFSDYKNLLKQLGRG